MKMRFLFPYWCRYLGLTLIVLHVPIALMYKTLGFDGPNAVGDDALFNSHHVFFICTALTMAIGLFLVAFAKEKIEDEQIAQLRLDSLRWAIYLNYAILILSLMLSTDTHHILLMNLWIPLAFFIIRFRWVIIRLNMSVSKEDGYEK
jgi:hypothetical protein